MDKKKLIWIGAGVLVLGGVIYYFYKNQPKIELKEPTPTPPSEEDNTGGSTTTTGGGGATGGGTTTTGGGQGKLSYNANQVVVPSGLKRVKVKASSWTLVGSYGGAMAYKILDDFSPTTTFARGTNIGFAFKKPDGSYFGYKDYGFYKRDYVYVITDYGKFWIWESDLQEY